MSTNHKKKKNSHAGSNGLLPGEEADIEKEVRSLVPDADTWLDTPNSRFGGSKPKDLIGTEREWRLRDVLRSIKYGLYV